MGAAFRRGRRARGARSVRGWRVGGVRAVGVCVGVRGWRTIRPVIIAIPRRRAVSASGGRGSAHTEGARCASEYASNGAVARG
eukprot:1719534-Prymnesium_polylepis.1